MMYGMEDKSYYRPKEVKVVRHLPNEILTSEMSSEMIVQLSNDDGSLVDSL